MKNIFFLFCFFLPFVVFSQNELQVIFPVNDGKTFHDTVKYEFLLADQVALRSNPALSGEIISRLKIGSRLLLKERSEEMMALNGIKCHWYQVEIDQITGWIWGGLIALQSFESSTDTSLKFLAGYKNSTFNSKTETYTCQYQVRVVKGNKELTKTVITTTGAIDSFENLGKKELDKVDDILKLKTICGSYDCIMQVVYLFWNEHKFYKVFELSETTDENQEGIHNIETLTFPSDSDGTPGMIAKILPANKKTVSTKINIEEIQGSFVLNNLNLTFDKISEQEFLKFKNNYDDQIVLDTSKEARPGFSFSLEFENGIEKFPCPEDYNGCYYYNGYLEPLELYIITIGHREYAESFVLSRNNVETFPLYSPFDSGANSLMISKEEDQLLFFATSVYDQATFIGHYKIEKENDDFSYSELSKFQTDEWNLEELVWINNNSFALKVKYEEEWNEETRTELEVVKYLKAKIGE